MVVREVTKVPTQKDGQSFSGTQITRKFKNTRTAAKSVN
jgi:hypothetical protein